MVKCVPIAESLFDSHGEGDVWMNASIAPCMPGLMAAVWH